MKKTLFAIIVSLGISMALLQFRSLFGPTNTATPASNPICWEHEIPPLLLSLSAAVKANPPHRSLAALLGVQSTPQEILEA
jgi:hypothetical protein